MSAELPLWIMSMTSLKRDEGVIDEQDLAWRTRHFLGRAQKPESAVESRHG
jgi:hypothetical protein